MNEGSLVFRWYDRASLTYAWIIRGLRVDGSFYGEVRSHFDAPRSSDGAAGVYSTIEGQLTPSETNRVFELANAIRNHPTDDLRSAQIGFLGDGPIDKVQVIFRYGVDDADSPAHKAFRELVAILRPHIEPLYPKLN